MNSIKWVFLMERVLKFIEFLNAKFIWGVPMIVFMIGTALFLSVVTDGVIFRRFFTVLKLSFNSLFRSKKEVGDGQISPFAAVCTALAATVGTGNIVGVALSIFIGGPGAVFWLWVSALLGMVTKYCEVTLAVTYKQKNALGETVGGPMYYIEKGLGLRSLAVCFAVFGVLASFGIGASVQANALTNSANNTFGIPFVTTGIIITVLSGMVLLGGIKSIARFSEILVPFMSAFYILGVFFILVLNLKALPSAFLLIFKSAFCGSAAVGGFMGATVIKCCRVGISRGVFTHEAGMGSAPIAHATAKVDHPARQGILGAFEVFFDSIIMCTLSALVIIVSGVWKAYPRVDSANAMSQAFEQGFSGGRYLVAVALVLFAFATITSWYYYGEKCVQYLFPHLKKIIPIYKLLYIGAVFLGSILNLNTVWAFCDLFNGLMSLPNLIALNLLSPVIRKKTREFFG